MQHFMQKSCLLWKQYDNLHVCMSVHVQVWIWIVFMLYMDYTQLHLATYLFLIYLWFDKQSTFIRRKINCTPTRLPHLAICFYCSIQKMLWNATDCKIEIHPLKVAKMVMILKYQDNIRSLMTNLKF